MPNFYLDINGFMILGIWAEERDKVVLKDVLALGEYLRGYAGFDQAMANVAYIAKNMEEQDQEGDVRHFDLL